MSMALPKGIAGKPKLGEESKKLLLLKTEKTNKAKTDTHTHVEPTNKKGGTTWFTDAQRHSQAQKWTEDTPQGNFQ